MTIMPPRLDDGLKLCCALSDAFPVLAIHHKDKSVCVIKVMPPERAKLLLASNIPDSEDRILVLHLLYIEACQVQEIWKSGLHGAVGPIHACNHSHVTEVCAATKVLKYCTHQLLGLLSGPLQYAACTGSWSFPLRLNRA